jgi:hypothetical protein
MGNCSSAFWTSVCWLKWNDKKNVIMTSKYHGDETTKVGGGGGGGAK